MHTEPREAPNLDHNYEVRDINARAIWMSTVYFFVFAVGSMIAGYLIFIFMNPGVHQDEAAIAAHREKLAKNVPALQSNMNVKTDLFIIRRDEEKKLAGAAQNENGTYSIPIEAAIKMLAETGGKMPNQAGSEVNDVLVSTPKAPATNPADQTAAPDVDVARPNANKEGHGEGGQP